MLVRTTWPRAENHLPDQANLFTPRTDHDLDYIDRIDLISGRYEMFVQGLYIKST